MNVLADRLDKKATLCFRFSDNSNIVRRNFFFDKRILGKYTKEEFFLDRLEHLLRIIHYNPKLSVKELLPFVNFTKSRSHLYKWIRYLDSLNLIISDYDFNGSFRYSTRFLSSVEEIWFKEEMDDEE